MELMIAILIAFGVITSEQKGELSRERAEGLMQEHSITKDDMKKQAKIIGLEETDY